MNTTITRKSENNIETIIQNSHATLEYYIENDYRIYLDTCALLKPAVGGFWMHVMPLLSKHNKKVYILQQAVWELEKLAKDKNDDSELITHILNALSVITTYGGVEVIKEFPDIKHHDQALLLELARIRAKSDVLIITNDKDLAFDAIDAAKVRSVNGNEVVVKRINRYGFLSSYTEERKETPSDALTMDAIESIMGKCMQRLMFYVGGMNTESAEVAVDSKEREAVAEYRICKCCGKRFPITKEEQLSYAQRQIPERRRCNDCIEAKKLHKVQNISASNNAINWELIR